MIVNSSQGGGSKDTWVLEADESALPDAPPLSRWQPPRMPGLPLGGAWSSQQQQQQQ
jgi:hypothetical protein